MVFQQYRSIVDRISRLDKPLSSLTRAERNEVLDLSIRQEELEKQIGEQIRSSFKELQDGLDIVAEWVKLMQEESIKALGVEGTPEEVLALEETLAQVNSLNNQISSLTLANYSNSTKANTKCDAKPTQEPAKASLKPVLSLAPSTIDMVETGGQDKIVAKVLEEIQESVVSAAPTYQPEIFNQPRIVIEKTKPSKKKKR
ncbi:hypothetical protein Desca_2423 [Desulfotomaculum nigrificans CO-1-SRB]|uniref:Uncharacterized protein n=1 Tax=Desulfotomaculum nigrificans (strain DSM 14880 / VKM B-2319 / CO-1-SRB) TaxID=868595 RepID=F6B474_DESCC|nr:hypothetical protein [Desulfotomaculum nigrificans]AEF95251.1 hypothetical protein Desca_2423 [Desulfotomaculum nigrificans CO-1-SRB]